MNHFRAYSYIYITALVFAGSLVVQWLTNDGGTRNFINAIAENWQSEMVQLIWQVLGLKYFLCRGSPSSKDEHEKEERKLDEMLNHLRVLRRRDEAR